MALANPMGSPVLILLACQLLLASSAFPLLASETPPVITSNEVSARGQNNDGAKGIASYYAPRYNGRKTCSGHRYNPEKLTAAHPDLPFGTRVLVVNLSNDRQVVVTVNDRCRKKSLPFIDLSRAAARTLGFLGKGIAEVKIIPLADAAESS